MRLLIISKCHCVSSVSSVQKAMEFLWKNHDFLRGLLFKSQNFLKSLEISDLRNSCHFTPRFVFFQFTFQTRNQFPFSKLPAFCRLLRKYLNSQKFLKSLHSGIENVRNTDECKAVVNFHLLNPHKGHKG